MADIDARTRVISRVADHLVGHPVGHPVRVAVDGVTAAGKTTFAAELAIAVAARGRATIRLTMDGFHHRAAHRHRQGRNSADGYYSDAYDFESFSRLVLEPLGPAGDRRYRSAIIDLGRDEPLDEPPVEADPDAILIVDGSFLQRPELAGQWDHVVYLDTSFAVARDRGSHRDADHFGGIDEAAHALDVRYHAAGRRYLDEVDPRGRADIVINNDDWTHPLLERIGGTEADRVLLFSYGTLQLPSVQRAQFGRLLSGTADALRGFESLWLTITDPEVIAASGTDRHPVVRRSAGPADEVAGTVFEITPVELAAADRYEVDDYRRHRVRLGSGIEAWVYLDAAT